MRAVVGLGSNLGDRLALLRAAAARLPGVVAASSIYETAPVGPPQPDYLNAAVLVERPGAARAEEARALLETMLEIERGLGRVRAGRWGPRTIDLDLLWVEGLAVGEPGLVVPHPHLDERAFALVPLLDVSPAAVHPRTGRRYADVAIDRSGLRPTADALR